MSRAKDKAGSVNGKVERHEDERKDGRRKMSRMKARQGSSERTCGGQRDFRAGKP